MSDHFTTWRSEGLTNEPNYESHFIKYATTQHYISSKTNTRSGKILRCCSQVEKVFVWQNISTFTIKLIKKKKKKMGGPEGGVWKEKRIVTLMSNLAFDFISCVCFPARSPVEQLTFLCTWCDVVFTIFKVPNLEFWISFAYESKFSLTNLTIT